jgi:hypothetical protein
MDTERKMVCVMADNAVGGVSSALMNSNGVYRPEERTMLNWALAPGEMFELGAVYCIAVIKLSGAPAAPDPKNA